MSLESYEYKYYKPFRSVNDDLYLLDVKPMLPEMIKGLNLPQPLKFVPYLSPRPWGGNKLKKIFARLMPENEKIGESWEISGYDNTVSIVREGALKGLNLNAIMNIWGQDMLGENVAKAPSNQFPLLAKFIDTADFLSVQVHPDDNFDDAGNLINFGKIEVWFIIDADADSFIYQGFNKETTTDEIKQRIQDGTLAEILNKVYVKSGDVIVNPARTVHSIGKSMLLYEVQQVSDATFRLYDFGRVNRELHIEQALEVMFLGKGLPEIQPPSTHLTASLNKLASTKYFNMFLIEISSGYKINLEELPNNKVMLLHCINGEFEIATKTMGFRIHKGESVLIPAICLPFDILSGEGKIIAVTP